MGGGAVGREWRRDCHRESGSRERSRGIESGDLSPSDAMHARPGGCSPQPPGRCGSWIVRRKRCEEWHGSGRSNRRSWTLIGSLSGVRRRSTRQDGRPALCSTSPIQSSRAYLLHPAEGALLEVKERLEARVRRGPRSSTAPGLRRAGRDRISRKPAPGLGISRGSGSRHKALPRPSRNCYQAPARRPIVALDLAAVTAGASRPR